MASAWCERAVFCDGSNADRETEPRLGCLPASFFKPGGVIVGAGDPSASMSAFEAFSGTEEMTFYATSSRFPGEQRLFHRFSDLSNEVLEARIWAGIHFRNADVQAANLGRAVVEYVDTHQVAFVH
jgi:hypothetical protein